MAVGPFGFLCFAAANTHAHTHTHTLTHSLAYVAAEMVDERQGGGCWRGQEPISTIYWGTFLLLPYINRRYNGRKNVNKTEQCVTTSNLFSGCWLCNPLATLLPHNVAQLGPRNYLGTHSINLACIIAIMRASHLPGEKGLHKMANSHRNIFAYLKIYF